MSKRIGKFKPFVFPKASEPGFDPLLFGYINEVYECLKAKYFMREVMEFAKSPFDGYLEDEDLERGENEYSMNFALRYKDFFIVEHKWIDLNTVIETFIHLDASPFNRITHMTKLDIYSDIEPGFSVLKENKIRIDYSFNNKRELFNKAMERKEYNKAKLDEIIKEMYLYTISDESDEIVEIGNRIQYHKMVYEHFLKYYDKSHYKEEFEVISQWGNSNDKEQLLKEKAMIESVIYQRIKENPINVHNCVLALKENPFFDEFILMISDKMIKDIERDSSYISARCLAEKEKKEGKKKEKKEGKKKEKKVYEDTDDEE